jgi:hypothetical protein
MNRPVGSEEMLRQFIAAWHQATFRPGAWRHSGNEDRQEWQNPCVSRPKVLIHRPLALKASSGNGLPTPHGGPWRSCPDLSGHSFAAKYGPTYK